MMKKSIIFLGLLLTSFQVSARQNMSPLLDQVQQRIEQQDAVKAAKEQLEWFDNNRYGAAYFDEIDFRVGGIIDNNTEYAFRLRPTNPFYYAAGKNMGRLLEQQAKLDFDEARQTAIFKKLQCWLDIRNYSLQIQQIQNSVDWREKWMANMEQYISDGEFDAEELLDLQLEKIDQQVDLMNLSDQLQRSLVIFYEGEEQRQNVSDLSFPDMNVDKLAVQLQELTDGLTAYPLAIQQEQLRLTVSENKLLLEKRDWDIGFVQPEWDMNGEDRFGLRVGIGIPIFNKNRVQTQNRELSLIGDKWSETTARKRLDIEARDGYQKILRSIERLQAIDELWFQLQTYEEKLAGIDPLEVRKSLLKSLKAKEKLRKRQIQDQFLLLNDYLNYLKLVGFLREPDATRFFENIW